MTRRRVVHGEREALTRTCPTCHAPAGDWCDADDLHLSRLRWLDARRAAPMIGVAFPTLLKWARRGKVPEAARSGSSWWFPVWWVTGFVERQTEERTA